jgi:hypothetical protein
MNIGSTSGTLDAYSVAMLQDLKLIDLERVLFLTPALPPALPSSPSHFPSHAGSPQPFGLSAYSNLLPIRLRALPIRSAPATLLGTRPCPAHEGSERTRTSWWWPGPAMVLVQSPSCGRTTVPRNPQLQPVDKPVAVPASVDKRMELSAIRSSLLLIDFD